MAALSPALIWELIKRDFSKCFAGSLFVIHLGNDLAAGKPFNLHCHFWPGDGGAASRKFEARNCLRCGWIPQPSGGPPVSKQILRAKIQNFKHVAIL